MKESGKNKEKKNKVSVQPRNWRFRLLFVSLPTDGRTDEQTPWRNPNEIANTGWNSYESRVNGNNYCM